MLSRINTRRIATVVTDFSVGVIELTVESRAFTTGDDAIGLGASLISINPCLISLDSCSLAARNRSIFDSVGDAILLALFALINTLGLILR